MSNLYRRNLPVPFFSQRENRYQWQRIAGDGGNDLSEATLTVSDISNGIEQRKYASNEPMGKPVPLASVSCNITSLCMILHYYGITKDTPDQMMKKFYEEIFPDFQHEKYQPDNDDDYGGPKQLMLWPNLEEYAVEAYGLPSAYVKQGGLSIDGAGGVKDQIKKGYPVMFSYGVIEGGTSGHIAVIRGFTEEDHIILNDPWGDVASPDGYLITDDKNNRRFYSIDDNTSRVYNYYGLGNGDNCVLRREEFNKVAKTKGLHQTIYIEYPHLWSFPLRIENDKILRFGVPFTDTTSAGEEQPPEDQKNEAENISGSEITEMLKMEVIEDACYPISTDRFWHDGIHITGNSPVYAIGPGRLVAVRMQNRNKMPSSGDNNFILLRHRVNIAGRMKEFYSHYMHLAPLDIADRIKKQIAGNDPASEKDWIDQLIEHIRPMRAIIGLNGNTETLPTYRLGPEMIPTGEYLPHNAIIYLCPLMDSTVKTKLENIDPREELERDMTWFYNAVNNKNNYKRQIGTSYYYAYYHKTPEGSVTEPMEIRYVAAPPPGIEGTPKVVPQIINMPEFRYYRRMLAKILKGETAVFCDEDILDNRNYQPGERQDGRVFFIDTIKGEFSDIVFGTSLHANWDILDEMYGCIREHYRGKRLSFIDLYQLTKQVCEFGRKLLSFPEGMFIKPNDVFKIGENWYNKLLKLYEDIIRQSFLPFTVNQNLEIVKAKLLASVRSNIDYHIEVNGNTRLGLPGRYRNKNNIIHFEILSDGNIISDTMPKWVENGEQFVPVPKMPERDDYYNIPKIIEKLREVDFLREPCFRYRREAEVHGGDLKDFFADKTQTSLQYAVVQHLHGHAKMEKNIWEQTIRNGKGLFGSILDSINLDEFLVYKWFSNELINELKPLSGNVSFRIRSGPCAFFYHPIRFLSWLDEKINSESNN